MVRPTRHRGQYVFNVLDKSLALRKMRLNADDLVVLAVVSGNDYVALMLKENMRVVLCLVLICSYSLAAPPKILSTPKSLKHRATFFCRRLGRRLEQLDVENLVDMHQFISSFVKGPLNYMKQLRASVDPSAQVEGTQSVPDAETMGVVLATMSDLAHQIELKLPNIDDVPPKSKSAEYHNVVKMWHSVSLEFWIDRSWIIFLIQLAEFRKDPMVFDLMDSMDKVWRFIVATKDSARNIKEAEHERIVLAAAPPSGTEIMKRFEELCISPAVTPEALSQFILENAFSDFIGDPDTLSIACHNFPTPLSQNRDETDSGETLLTSQQFLASLEKPEKGDAAKIEAFTRSFGMALFRFPYLARHLSSIWLEEHTPKIEDYPPGSTDPILYNAVKEWHMAYRNAIYQRSSTKLTEWFEELRQQPSISIIDVWKYTSECMVHAQEVMKYRDELESWNLHTDRTSLVHIVQRFRNLIQEPLASLEELLAFVAEYEFYFYNFNSALLNPSHDVGSTFYGLHDQPQCSAPPYFHNEQALYSSYRHDATDAPPGLSLESHWQHGTHDHPTAMPGVGGYWPDATHDHPTAMPGVSTFSWADDSSSSYPPPRWPLPRPP
ncbi:hypothetical protein SeMB42_g04393 [Synchytrium endobioticum]|uniref:Uncharacterized protein n=1 Tax=Synchytrium endobioticum TaxID=286115 RepID=A0A507CYP2_9FUNG|nr:hypothetical protein SeMB42_g04393 [Synchytrium endobioticum]